MKTQTDQNFVIIKLAVISVIFLIITVSAKPAECEINAWPFVEITDETTTVLYPFYVNEKDFKMIFPFYYNTDNGKDHHFLWPFFKMSEGRLTRIAPFWFNEEESYTFFPFIRRTPEYTLWTIPPVYFDHDIDFFGIFPLYMTNSAKKFIFPSIYMKKNVNSGELERFVFFPLYYYQNKDEIKKRNIAIFFSSEHGKHHAQSRLFPVYEKTNKSDEKSLWLFPYYQKVTRKTKITGFFPLYYSRCDQAFFGAKERVVWTLWPIYSKKETLSDSGVIDRKRRFLIFSDELDKNRTRKMKIFGFPVRETFSTGMTN